MEDMNRFYYQQCTLLMRAIGSAIRQLDEQQQTQARDTLVTAWDSFVEAAWQLSFETGL